MLRSGNETPRAPVSLARPLQQIQPVTRRGRRSIADPKQIQMSRQGCPFCDIVSGGLPPHGLFEDDDTFVILDRKPLSFGHCMVVPKRHVVKLYDLSPPEHARVLALTQRLASTLEQSLECTSVAYMAFGSGIPHAHLHVVPHDDPSVVLEPLKHVDTRSDEQLARDADRLRETLPEAWHPPRV